ncbi:MAG: tRNA glutamyl-Q(34) synthetase GluQRS [Oceanobacter sp.]
MLKSTPAIEGYRGRFAPSPTGPLHFGSLLAALASFLEAKTNQGQWLLRIEDLDPPREDPAAASHFLNTLEAYGLEWDETERYQSQRYPAYQEALERLIESDRAFPCQCSRKQLQGRLHHGRCLLNEKALAAWRFEVEKSQLSFFDQLQGHQQTDVFNDIGDFVIRRRDQLWSYQLAVVVDDQDQNISHVVRGIDLLDSTPRQLLLQQALGAPAPEYAHLPVATEINGQKLSKQNLALPIKADTSGDTLFDALAWLHHSPPDDLRGAGNAALIAWALDHWSMEKLMGIKAIAAPRKFQSVAANDASKRT